MKSVLFIVSTLRKSGPTNQLLHLCRELPQFGFRPRVLTLSPENPADTASSRFNELGVQWTSVGLSRLAGTFLLKRRVRQVIDEVRPDVIHSQGLRSDQVASQVHGSIPHVLTIRNSAWDDYPPMYGRLKGSLMAWQHLQLIRTAQCPIACSKSLAENLQKYRPNLKAIPNGVDTEAYTPVPASEQSKLRRQLGLPESRPILLHVGSLIERKRPRELLKALQEGGMLESMDLVFAGDGPLRAEMERHARSNAHVHFAGAVKNVADYLRSATLLISLSRAEGLPNSVLEALSCGLPVVLSAIDAHIEIGAHENGAGVLVQDTSAKSVSDAISRLLSQDRTLLADNARRLAVDVFSSRSTAARYAETYSALLASGK